jgi:hypothetical protein
MSKVWRDAYDEAASYDLLRDAKMLSCAPPEWIEHNREWIEEARELLNDALAKADRTVSKMEVVG